MTERRVPAGFVPLEQIGFLDHVGGIWIRRHADRADTCLVIGAAHTNPNGTAHGGVLLALLDFTLGVTAEQLLTSRVEAPAAAGRHPATVSLTANFLAGVGANSLVLGSAHVQQQTRSLTFVAGELVSDGKKVAAASAVFRNPPR